VERPDHVRAGDAVLDPDLDVALRETPGGSDEIGKSAVEGRDFHSTIVAIRATSVRALRAPSTGLRSTLAR
jgi:hypothetical protein